MRLFLIFLLTIACLSLTGCFSTLQISSDRKDVATANVKGLDVPMIIYQRKKYFLSVNSSGYARIPTGSLIGIINEYSYCDGMETISCDPTINFTAERGKEYYVDFYIKGNDCTLTLLSRKKGTHGPYRPVYRPSYDEDEDEVIIPPLLPSSENKSPALPPVDLRFGGTYNYSRNRTP